jgi:hypothetical protein
MNEAYDYDAKCEHNYYINVSKVVRCPHCYGEEE